MIGRFDHGLYRRNVIFCSVIELRGIGPRIVPFSGLVATGVSHWQSRLRRLWSTRIRLREPLARCIISKWIAAHVLALRRLVQVGRIGVEHVRQDILGVLEALDHLEVGGLHGTVQWVSATLALLVHVGHDLRLRAQHDLGVVLEVHLHHLVRQAEHDRVPRSHPFLHIDDILHLPLLLAVSVLLCYVFGPVIAFQIAPEMLEECDFLLELLRVLSERILLADVLPITRPSLHVVEVVTVGVQNNFGGIVEENARGFVRQVVAEAVFC